MFFFVKYKITTKIPLKQNYPKTKLYFLTEFNK